MKRVLVMILVLCFAGVAQAELLTANRGFEAGDTSDWLQWGSGSGAAGWQSWNDSFTVVNDGTAHSGDYYARLGQDAQGGWAYNVAWQGEATTIAGGAGLYTMSYWARSSDTTNAVIKFESSSDFFATDKVEQEVGAAIVSDGTWQFVTANFSAPTGTNSLRAVVGGNSGTFTIDVDDVSLTIIPEPATMVLFGLGLGGLLLRRRRQGV